MNNETIISLVFGLISTILSFVQVIQLWLHCMSVRQAGRKSSKYEMFTTSMLSFTGAGQAGINASGHCSICKLGLNSASSTFPLHGPSAKV
jgi:hypothetical protein